MNARDEMGALAPVDGAAAARAGTLMRLANEGGMRAWRLNGRELLPVVQGGMGVGVSAGGLAGAVASLGGVGTVSSVDLRRLPGLRDVTTWGRDSREGGARRGPTRRASTAIRAGASPRSIAASSPIALIVCSSTV